jgi:hypothetical protein
MIFYAICTSLFRVLKTYGPVHLLNLNLFFHAVLVAIALGVAMYSFFQIGGLEREVEILKRNMDTLQKKQFKLHKNTDTMAGIIGQNMSRIEALEEDHEILLSVLTPLPQEEDTEFVTDADASADSKDACGECCGEEGEAAPVPEPTSLNTEATVSST